MVKEIDVLENGAEKKEKIDKVICHKHGETNHFIKKNCSPLCFKCIVDWFNKNPLKGVRHKKTEGL